MLAAGIWLGTGQPALLSPLSAIRFLIFAEQAIGFSKECVVDQPEVWEVSKPLVSILRRTVSLNNLTCGRVAYVSLFPPRPNPCVFLVSQQPGQVLVTPLSCGRAMVLGSAETI